MSLLLGIAASPSSLSGVISDTVVNSTSELVTSNVGLFVPALSGTASSVVEISYLGKLMSAAIIFQEQLVSLQIGSVTSGGGSSHSADISRFTDESQSFVNIFNDMEKVVTSTSSLGRMLGDSIPGELAQALHTKVQSNYFNGSSTLTSLSQIGIDFQRTSAGGGTLNVNLNTLESAFNKDAAGAISLLSQVENALVDLAGNYVSLAGKQLPALSMLALAQSSTFNQSLSDNGLFSVTRDFFDFTNSLDLGSSRSTLKQVVAATNAYTLVSTLFG